MKGKIIKLENIIIPFSTKNYAWVGQGGGIVETYTDVYIFGIRIAQISTTKFDK